jgi:tryptophan synthase alpha chain
VGRIEQTLASLRKERKKALVYFVTAGYPELGSTAGVAEALEDGGADMIEIGMPFSDPLADGPVIQHSSTVAIQNGITMERVFEIVQTIRSRSSIPLILMGYLNPIMRYGVDRFFSEAAHGGVDGIILPELPLEEVYRFHDQFRNNNLAQILLVTPTTSQERISQIDAAACGFLYCVSTSGVTGTSRTTDVKSYLKRVREHTSKNALLVGFGISTPDDAAAVASVSDGVIIGSALMRQMDKSLDKKDLRTWASGFRKALNKLSD